MPLLHAGSQCDLYTLDRAGFVKKHVIQESHRFLRSRLPWEKEKINPDCTFDDLWSNHLEAQIFTDSTGFEVRVRNAHWFSSTK